MTVLVTGGAGYIGSHMVYALVDAGDRVLVLDNLSTGFDWAVAPGASLVIGDAGDQARRAALIAEHDVDTIIHFAASIVVPELVRDPLAYYRRALRQSPARAGSRGRPHRANLALRLLQAHELAWERSLARRGTPAVVADST